MFFSQSEGWMIPSDLSSAHYLPLCSPICSSLNTRSPSHSLLHSRVLAYIFQLLQLARPDLWLFCSVRLLSTAWAPLPCAVAQHEPLGRKPHPAHPSPLVFPVFQRSKFSVSCLFLENCCLIFLSSFILFWWGTSLVSVTLSYLGVGVLFDVLWCLTWLLTCMLSYVQIMYHLNICILPSTSSIRTGTLFVTEQI